MQCCNQITRITYWRSAVHFYSGSRFEFCKCLVRERLCLTYWLSSSSSLAVMILLTMTMIRPMKMKATPTPNNWLQSAWKITWTITSPWWFVWKIAIFFDEKAIIEQIKDWAKNSFLSIIYGAALFTLIMLLGIMLERIIMKPRRMKTMPRWKVVTMDSDLFGGGARTTSSSSVPVLATLWRLVQMMELPVDAWLPRFSPNCWDTWLAPLSRLILLSRLWCLFSLSILTAMALCMAEVRGILILSQCHLQLISFYFLFLIISSVWWQPNYSRVITEPQHLIWPQETILPGKHCWMFSLKCEFLIQIIFIFCESLGWN